MELSSSDEEGDQMEFWNNWLPNEKLEEANCAKIRSARTPTKNVVFNTSRVTSVSSYAGNPNFGNWIPPLIFLNNNSRTKVISKISEDSSGKKRKISSEQERVAKETQEVLKQSDQYSLSITWKKEINIDWGERVQLHDVTKFSDGNTLWGIVNPGLFANIKLWVNQYGNICGSADGKISRLISSGMTYISITNTHLLRKMLGLSRAQWASLCETIEETKATLKFDAFENFDLTKKSHLEKLWFFTCKRRHFLPYQCMLVKLSGAVKCMKQFEIIPKVIVVDIRNISGQPIL